MARVKVIKRFNDVKVRPYTMREVGTTFEVTEERAKYLVEQGMVEIIKETEKDKEKNSKKES